MYKLVIFDMDGVLLDSERLKAESYAEAIYALSHEKINKDDVIEQFKEVVGASRQVVVHHLVEYFDLHNMLDQGLKMNLKENVVSVLSNSRVNIYKSMLADNRVIQSAVHKQIVALVHWLKQRDILTAVATMSHGDQARKILKELGLLEQFDLVLTANDVSKAKPDPEIYQKTVNHFNIKSDESLVIEDSINGIKAALAANIEVKVLLTEITRHKVRETDLVKADNIFSGQFELSDSVKKYFA